MLKPTIAAMAVFFMSGTALGQQTCGPRDEVKEYLAERYGEATVARGVIQDGLLMEMLRGPTGGWSLLVIFPDGRACFAMVGAGLELETPPPVLTGRES